MNILESLFSGAKVFLRQAAMAVSEVVRVVLEEIDRSPFGKAATQLVQGVTRKYFSQAEDLADEERELADKFRRDGKRTEEDAERVEKIHAERERLRKEMEAAKAREAAEEFKSERDDVIAADMTEDELSAAIGILASKICPTCGGTMRIRQGAFNVVTNKRRFWWQCTMTNSLPCPTIKFDPEAFNSSVLRKENADLDGDAKKRREIWARSDVTNKTHSRLRQNHLDEQDEEVVCPHHLMPMKLVQKRGSDGLMLSSYEYVCMGVKPDGRACSYSVALETFPQVSAMLIRREGRGII